jgi:hypothetical protein
MHQHTYAVTARITLTLPTTDGRYDLLSAYQCACGHRVTTVAWTTNHGQHHGLAGQRAIQAYEQVHGPQLSKGMQVDTVV